MKFSELKTGQFFRPIPSQWSDNPIYLRTPAIAHPPETFDGVTNYIRATTNALGQMDDNQEVVLVDDETGLAAHNTSKVYCELCAELLPALCMEERRESYYDWDNPDEDAAGSILLHRTYYICQDTEQCRRNRRELAEIKNAMAAQHDGMLREAGWGAIGNGARGGAEV